MDKIHRITSVAEFTGLSRSSIYAKAKSGDFPAPVSLGLKAVGWKESDLADWIDSREPKTQRAQPIGGSKDG